MNPDSEDNSLLKQQEVWVRAYRALAQLQAWRERGLAPQLHSASDGWVLVLDTTKWGQMEVNERTRSELIRYCTAPCETPEGAIEAALKVVQP